MKKITPSLIIIFVTCIFTSFAPLYAQESFTTAQVRDISNRAYERAVIDLLDGAKESIVVSMYVISLPSKKNNPIRLLLEDLIEARGRGVSVTLYLNTRFRDIDKTKIRLIENPALKRLEDAGCVIHLMPPNRTLHDKLVIVDSRYVVEGSTNWTISALRNNFESATLIDSPELAKTKLLRLELLPVSTKPQTEEPRGPLYTENIAETLNIPKTLLEDKKYFSQMLTYQDRRSMDLYLMLLAHSHITDKKEFFVNMESMGISLGMPDTWNDTDIRRKVIVSLKTLQSQYKVIDVRFFHGKDAWVEIIDIHGDSFTISSSLIKATSDKELSMRLKFILMIKAFLKTEGKDIGSVSTSEITKRFHGKRETVKRALRDLRKYEGNVE
ncbi:MAG: phospholipase D-like domain-containing protein [Omnitrophica bacterium]|nr:phospholipase D-like domain-containing protein [Candidatus Omnitrophota bacterium]